MASAQSPPTPPPGTRPRRGDWGWLIRFTLRGFAELVRARLVFARLRAADIPHRNRLAATAANADTTPDRSVLVARIAYALPRISARLPWRSDCLIQAIAAQNWLAAHRLASELRIGVARPDDGPFGAHAWLVQDDMIVTGGDIARYELLLAQAHAACSDDAAAIAPSDTR